MKRPANFLRNQNWREVLAQVPDAEILVRILESDLRPDDPASLNAFMSSLAPAEEWLVSAWLMQRMPPNAGEVAEEWWHGIRQGILRRQLEIGGEPDPKLPQLSTRRSRQFAETNS